jgi:hypothetical protein
MAAGVYQVNIEQGATFRLHVTWQAPNGSPIDLTGQTAHMQIRTAHDGALLLELTDTAGITLGGTAGTIDIVITATQTSSLTVWRAVYDLYIIPVVGDRTRLLEGPVVVDPTVTLTP